MSMMYIILEPIEDSLLLQASERLVIGKMTFWYSKHFRKVF